MRIFLQVILPLIAPAVLYAIWTNAARRKAGQSGLPGWEEGHWFWMIVAGFVLVVAIFVFFVLGNRDEDGTYIPPRFEDGKVIPGRIVPDAPPVKP